MTPHPHLSHDVYVDAYLSEISADLRSARTSRGLLRVVRRSIARSLVRSGVWLLPDKPEAIGHTVIVLSQSPSDDHRKAA
ncbi:MAG: hypothetical protein ACC654_04700 [Acidimicrobiia bacterium]